MPAPGHPVALVHSATQKKPGDLPGFKGVKSPSEFFDLSANHSRKQFETLTEQAKEFVVQQRNAVRAAGYNL
jgi:hypothetical protein